MGMVPPALDLFSVKSLNACDQQGSNIKPFLHLHLYEKPRKQLKVCTTRTLEVFTRLANSGICLWLLNLPNAVISLGVQPLCWPWRGKSAMRNNWVRSTALCPPLSTRGKHWRMPTPTLKSSKIWAWLLKQWSMSMKKCKWGLSKWFDCFVWSFTLTRAGQT